MKKNVFVLLFVITIIIGIATPAFAERLKYTGLARSEGGAVLASATVAVYLAGTTTPADVYEASSGGTSVNEVTTDSNGRWTFYADTTDYAFTQEYKVVVTKDGYSSITLDNIFILRLPTNAVGVLTNDGSGNYTWSASSFSESGDYSPTGTWDFSGGTITIPSSLVSSLKEDLSVDDLISLSGVAEGSTHLGTFSGSIITNNQSIKEALQELETAIEDIEVPEETNPFEFAKKDDVVIGTGDGTAGRLAKGDNNTLLGVDQTGKLGYHKYMSVILADPSMLGDGGATFSYSGIVKKFVCGENLTASNVVYCKNVGGAARCFKYKANGDDKTMPPRALALSDCAAVADFYGLVFGTMKNNSWGMTMLS